MYAEKYKSRFKNSVKTFVSKVSERIVLSKESEQRERCTQDRFKIKSCKRVDLKVCSF